MEHLQKSQQNKSVLKWLLNSYLYVVSLDHIAFFVVSTFGNGDPPSDAKVFANNINKIAEAKSRGLHSQIDLSSLR